MKTIENQLFNWDGWDGDHECMTYYKVVLNVQIGKYLPGTPFDSATILFDTGVLQLDNYGKTVKDADGRESAPLIPMGSYNLNLTVGGTITE